MQTDLAKKLGIEFPIFAFTHCRDVVVAVSKAGGLGVLGAVGFTPEQLETELAWIDEHIGDRPYGVDIVIPGKYEGMGATDADKLQEDLKAMIPQEHRDFVQKLLAEHGVPEIPEDEKMQELIGFGTAIAGPQAEIALSHDKCVLLANALGTPPPDVIDNVHSKGKLIAALCGSAAQAARHKAAGVDIIIAQGTEGGGHTGEIASMVLWPEVLDVLGDTPMLAAGGVGSGRQMAAALAMGAQGVWTGSLWLTVEEADVPPAQMASLFAATSKDTLRSRSWTGKPCRMLRNDWTEAWEEEGNPKPLGMPMQFMVTSNAVQRGHKYPEQARDVQFNPVGQIVGRMTKARPAKDVIFDLVEECIESTERLNKLMTVDAEA
ncbi:MAG: nitronate monooxygenase [Acidimicrobiales bacterium]|jgi:NAD(P)H-dependent flavin oxidoreductase YrpB (nitropropane dioxygenase family)|nr:nitronate monooxygenase [Acidimicrobiales bacterium]